MVKKKQWVIAKREDGHYWSADGKIDYGPKWYDDDGPRMARLRYDNFECGIPSCDEPAAIVNHLKYECRLHGLTKCQLCRRDRQATWVAKNDLADLNSFCRPHDMEYRTLPHLREKNRKRVGRITQETKTNFMQRVAAEERNTQVAPSAEKTHWMQPIVMERVYEDVEPAAYRNPASFVPQQPDRQPDEQVRQGDEGDHVEA